uniref:Exosome component 7 n=1 Tax=Ornithorhynchus anatinus TaxID=9258 RepID=A0A6I8NDX7_ORNAN
MGRVAVCPTRGEMKTLFNSWMFLQGHTDILVGVKAEMGTPKLEKPKEGFLEFFVDCSANAAPEFEGRGGDELGTEIANTLYRIFNNKSSIDLESLCISPREHCWVLYVDVLLLECGGNLFDAISIAVKAALFNTRIPRVQVLEDEEGSKDIELSDDPYDCIRLNVENVPCIVTLSKIGYRHVVDATLQEEACSLARLLVSVTNKGILTCMRKVGKGSLDPESVFEMIETGKRVGKMVHSSLQSVLHKEESLGPKRQKVGFLG